MERHRPFLAQLAAVGSSHVELIRSRPMPRRVKAGSVMVEVPKSELVVN
jgi:hypothetical protein